MAAVAKSGTPSPCTVIFCPGHQVGSGLIAGEAIAAGDACYIKGADGLVYKSTGAAANEAANVDGFAPMKANSGEAVTLLTDLDFHYGAALTPGVRYFLSGTTAGGLDTVASTGGVIAVARALDATRIRVYANR